jgi:hypothetical protein
MSFRCPACAGRNSLAIVRRLELPPDARSDEITLQVVRCWSCDFRGIAVYGESRRGGFDDEHYSHTGYRVPLADAESIDQALARCPTPGKARCTCRTHRIYSRRDANGRWSGLDNVDLRSPFPMER